MKRQQSNIRLGLQRQAAKDTDVTFARVVTHLRRSPKDTVRRFGKKRSSCILMVQAYDGQDGNSAFITKPWPIGQRNKLSNYLKRLCRQRSKPPNLMRSLPILAIKKPNLSHYTCRSRNALLFRLESGLGTLTSSCASHRRPCS